MKIVFTTLRYQNFLSSGNQWTEIRLNDSPLTLIVGKNGAGKSTILDALAFCLFKKPFRKLNLDLLVNTITRKNTLVEVEFYIGNDVYKIIRGLKPNKFEIYKNEVLINQTNADDYQTYLEEHILRINHKAFCQVVVLGSASYKPFLELPTPERRTIIENLLDLEIFSSMNVILKKRNQENEKSLINTKNEIRLFQDRIEQQKEYNEKRKSQNEAEIAELEKKLDSLRQQVKDKRALLVDDMSGEIETATKSVIFRSREIVNTESKIRYAENALEKLEKEINFYRDSCICDTCKQEIDEQFKQDIIEEKTIEVQTIRSNILDFKRYIEEEKVKFQEASENLENKTILKQGQDLFKIELRNLVDQGKETRERVDRLAAEIVTPDNEALNANIAKLEEVSAQYEKEMKAKEIMAELLKLLKDDGIKAKIIHQYIDMINKSINKYLDDMEFMCEFNLDENFDEVIKSRYRDKFVWNSFSQGEKMRIDLAILLTWRKVASKRNSINTNILFFDEVLDGSLDAEGIDSYLEIIKKLTEGSNVFIISHNDKNIDRIDNSIKFVKRKGFSRIEDAFNK